MRIAIVTGADTAFFEMLRTLILSLEGHAPFSDIDLCVQDFGLSDGDRDWLQSHAQAVAAPARVVEADPKRKFKPPHIADTSRPFLRETFPGYDMYLWMDADTWVQDWAAIELYMAAAESGALAITPEIDRAYAPTPSKIRRHPLPSRATLKREISFNNYRNGFGFKAATTYWNLPVFNSAFSPYAMTRPIGIIGRRISGAASIGQPPACASGPSTTRSITKGYRSTPCRVGATGSVTGPCRWPTAQQGGWSNHSCPIATSALSITSTRYSSNNPTNWRRGRAAPSNAP